MPTAGFLQTTLLFSSDIPHRGGEVKGRGRTRERAVEEGRGRAGRKESGRAFLTLLQRDSLI